VFPLPGKVYSRDGERDSALEKNCRFEYFAAHIDCEAAGASLTAVPSLPDDAADGATAALVGRGPSLPLLGNSFAAFNFAFFAIIAVSSNCKKKEEYRRRAKIMLGRLKSGKNNQRALLKSECTPKRPHF
jgi:hypothetical protein